jgi:hypothetical protein
MGQTRDWAKLGQTTYQAEIRYDDGTDPHVHHPCLPEGQEFTCQGLAKAWVAHQIRQLGQPGQLGQPESGAGCFYGLVQRGTYQDASRDDRGQPSGLQHAVWQSDQEPHHYQGLASLTQTRSGLAVVWDEDRGEVA